MPDSVLYLSKSDVEAVNLSMAEIIDGLDRMFVEKGEGRVEMPPKTGYPYATGCFYSCDACVYSEP